MSNGIVWLSLAGVVFFAVRLFMDPVHWLAYAVGIAACLFVWVRQRRDLALRRPSVAREGFNAFSPYRWV